MVPQPRTDGLYRSDLQPLDFERGEAPPYWRYLRFYPNNRVIALSTTGTPKEISEWFKEERASTQSMSIGDYRAENRTFSFTLQGSIRNADHDGYEYESRVDYTITIEDDEANLLTSRWHSHINGNSGIETYRFVSFDEDS